MFRPALHEIEEEIGIFNKFIVLSPQGFEIFNEDDGLWHDNCWYSNKYAWSAPLIWQNYQHKSYQHKSYWNDWESLEFESKDKNINSSNDDIYAIAYHEIDAWLCDNGMYDIYALIDSLVLEYKYSYPELPEEEVS